jgi:hypothetical protein
MEMLLAEWSFAASRRLIQIGLLLDALGAGLLVVAAVVRLWRDHVAWVLFFLAAALLLGAGFVLILLSVHWGVNPYSPRT